MSITNVQDWLLNLRQEYTDLNEEKIRLETEKPPLWEARLKANYRKLKTCETKQDIAKHLSYIVKVTNRGSFKVEAEDINLEFEWS